MWYKHVASENEKLFGCSVPWHPPYETKNGKKIEVCRNVTLAANATRLYKDNQGTPLSEDLIPCAWYEISLGIPDVSDQPDESGSTKAYINFYIKTKIKQKSIVIYYDSTTLAAEIGGYVGMFLGVSLVDMAIIFDSAFLVMIRKIFG